ncbi:unnamed protein product, partial [Ectocarpus sp. 12 AP-2014]
AEVVLTPTVRSQIPPSGAGFSPRLLSTAVWHTRPSRKRRAPVKRTSADWTLQGMYSPKGQKRGSHDGSGAGSGIASGERRTEEGPTQSRCLSAFIVALNQIYGGNRWYCSSTKE